jgi:hypothetical protein
MRKIQRIGWKAIDVKTGGTWRRESGERGIFPLSSKIEQRQRRRKDRKCQKDVKAFLFQWEGVVLKDLPGRGRQRGVGEFGVEVL